MGLLLQRNFYFWRRRRRSKGRKDLAATLKIWQRGVGEDGGTVWMREEGDLKASVFSMLLVFILCYLNFQY